MLNALSNPSLETTDMGKTCSYSLVSNRPYLISKASKKVCQFYFFSLLIGVENIKFG